MILNVALSNDAVFGWPLLAFLIAYVVVAVILTFFAILWANKSNLKYQKSKACDAFSRKAN